MKEFIMDWIDTAVTGLFFGIGTGLGVTAVVLILL